MLGENIKILRKEKGYTQETLAERLNVVRQTISKWEKGISVPDAEMLNELSELFEVPVSKLLGSNINEEEAENNSKMDEVAKQLAILNEQLASQAARKRKTAKRIVMGIIIAIAGIILLFFLYIVALVAFRSHVASQTEYYRTSIECELNGETYGYEILYDQNRRVHECGGDVYISNHVDLGAYNDVGEMTAHIEDYFTEHGGTYKVIVEDEPYEK